MGLSFKKNKKQGRRLRYIILILLIIGLSYAYYASRQLSRHDNPTILGRGDIVPDKLLNTLALDPENKKAVIIYYHDADCDTCHAYTQASDKTRIEAQGYAFVSLPGSADWDPWITRASEAYITILVLNHAGELIFTHSSDHDMPLSHAALLGIL